MTNMAVASCKLPVAGLHEPKTGNWQRATANRQPATGNRQPATGNRQPATGNRQLATGNRQPATGNWQLVARIGDRVKLTERRVTDLLVAFRSSDPTPGGGSAAALAGGTWASLFAMVAALPKSRAATEEDVERLKAAGDRCAAIASELESLVDRDSEAYDL